MDAREQVLTYDDVDKLFEALRVEHFQDKMGYRGHARQGWYLLPLLTRRNGKTNDEWFQIELDAFREFKKETQRYFSALESANLVQPVNHLQIQSAAVMQHYRGPTRLLDWSYSPYVALFFAAIDDHEHDGCVWSFPWKRAEEEADARWETCLKEVVTRERGRVNISDLAFRTDGDPDKSKRAVDFFAPTQYPDPFPRLNKQEGFFTIAGRLASGRQAVDHKDKLLNLGVPLRKHIVHRRFKRDILIRLECMEINAMTLDWQEADAVGRRITKRIADIPGDGTGTGNDTG